MSYSFGGAPIADMEFTRAWGLSPGAAAITCVGSSGLVVDGEYVLTLGADSYYGVLTHFVDELQDGERTRISFVDRRVRLMADTVFGLFNRIEVREDDPETPGIDRQKRYQHILPVDWAAQKITTTTGPLTAHQIIQYCLDAPTVGHVWSPVYHDAQEAPIHEVDANTGKKLGNILQEISDAQGLLFTLDGFSTLRWERKGVGTTPTYDPSSTDEISDGEAVSANDTQITVVGDRNRYQVINLELTPDWSSAYEEFVTNEGAWASLLASILGLDPFNDFSDAAELAARMRTYTVRELVTQRGDIYSDRGMWGEVSRMEIPVRSYIHDIVFKAYRIPLDYSLNGAPLDSLELVEGLLTAIVGDLNGNMTENADPPDGGYYPDSKAFLMVQGQKLGLIDPTKQRVLTPEELSREATEFSPNNRFNLDVRNKTIVFEDQVFVSTDLIAFPNYDLAVSESLKYIGVPNAGATVSDATVLAALVFDADRYNKVFGSGPRSGSHYVPGLGKHLLSDGTTEIPYADGHLSDDKAETIAATLIAQEPFYQAGGFKRNGATGTVLNGVIDRVTVRLSYDEAISEHVEYSKERAQSNFEAERDLERKQRARDLYPGQRKLKDESKELDLIAKVSKELKRSPLQPVYGSFADLMEKPIGAPDCSVKKIWDDNIWLAGVPMFLGADDRPSNSSEKFAGITIADGATGLIPIATQGTVPCRVTGPFKTGDAVGIDPGIGQEAYVGGSRYVGKIAGDSYTGSDLILVPVQIGAHVKQTDEFPFQVVSRNNPDTGVIELGVTSNSHLFNSEDRDTYEEDNSDWGLLDDDQISGWFNDIDDNSFGDKIWLQIELDENQEIIAIDVMHGEVGDENWSTYPNPIEINDDDPGNVYQQFYHQIIAEITHPDEDPRPGEILTVPNTDPPVQIQVTQLLRANLMMTTAHTTDDAQYPGLPLLVAQLWESPGTDTEGHADEINDVPEPEGGGDPMTPWAFGDGGVTDESETPFQVVARQIRDSGGHITDLQLGVISNSHLFNARDRDTYEEPNDDWGLLDDDRTTGWNGGIDEGSIGDKIWLDITLDSNRNITAIDVNVGPVAGEDWQYYPDPIELDDDGSDTYQSHYYQIIAEITDPDEDPREGMVLESHDGEMVQVTQLLRTNLMMQSAHTTTAADDPDVDLLVATPWDGPGTDTEGNANEIPPGTDLMTPWQYGDENDQIFAFAMFDASVTDDARVLIMDGDVIDQDGNGHTPEDMGNDDFIAHGLQDGDAIYLKIQHDAEWNVIDPVTIEWDQEVPPDDDQYSYVEIGYVEVTTGDSGTVPQVTPHNTVCGDYAFVPPEPFNRYAFEIIDASNDDGARVRIIDGDVIDRQGEGHTPEGMGDDDFIADGLQDGDTFYLKIPHDSNWNITGQVTVEWDQEVPEDTDEIAYIEFGYVSVEDDGEGTPQITDIHNTACGDIEFMPPIPDDISFSFKLWDASEEGTAQVGIDDGQVLGCNDEPIYPDGMPDHPPIPVADGDEIWIKIVWDLETDDGVSGDNIQSVTIEHGADTPEDDGLTQYITIGHVDVDLSGAIPLVTPYNEVTEDVYIPYPPHLDTEDDIELRADPDTGNVVWKLTDLGDDNDYSFKMTDASDEEGTKVDVNGGWVIGPNGDPIQIDPQVLDISPEQEVYLAIVWDEETDDEVSGDDLVSAELAVGDTPDDEGLNQYVTIGAVHDDGHGGLICANATCGDVVIPYPPSLDSDETLQLSVDHDTGDVVWKTSKIAQITTEDLSDEEGGDDFVQDVDVLTFDEQSFDIFDLEGGQCGVKLTLEPLQVTTEDASGYVGGGEGEVDNVDVLTFDENSFEIYDGGGGQAVVKSGGVSVYGSDDSFVDNVKEIDFEVADDPSANVITVEEESPGSGVCIVKVPLIPESAGGFTVLADDGGDTHWQDTETCGCPDGGIDGGGP